MYSFRQHADRPTSAHTSRRVLVGIGVTIAFTAAACSTPGEPAETGDPIDGTADITVGNVGVVDGTEDGLDLDNGNIPGSQNDQDLDPFDEENDLNTSD